MWRSLEASDARTRVAWDLFGFCGAGWRPLLFFLSQQKWGKNWMIICDLPASAQVAWNMPPKLWVLKLMCFRPFGGLESDHNGWAPTQPAWVCPRVYSRFWRVRVELCLPQPVFFNGWGVLANKLYHVSARQNLRHFGTVTPGHWYLIPSWNSQER